MQRFAIFILILAAVSAGFWGIRAAQMGWTGLNIAMMTLLMIIVVAAIAKLVIGTPKQ